MFDKLRNMLSKKIHVKFIDIESGITFAVSDMLPNQLPDSFEAQTTMNLCGENWEVVEVKPVTSTEFIKSGELTLILRKVNIQEVNPKDLLFSLPSISNELPPIQERSTKLNRNVFEIREDDWRQIDSLPKSKQKIINDNLTAINNIFENCSIEKDGALIGFKELHVRCHLDSPFENENINEVTFLNDVNAKFSYEGISFRGIAGVVDGGFALELYDDIVLYGVEKDGRIYSLSIYNKDGESLERKIGGVLKVFKNYDLCLVDWCNLKQYSIDEY